RVVDPDIDRAELVLDALRGGEDLLGIRDVDGDRERSPTGRLHLTSRGPEAPLAAGQERDVGSVLGEDTYGGATDPGARARDHDDLGPVHDPPRCKGGAHRLAVGAWCLRSAPLEAPSRRSSMGSGSPRARFFEL